MSYLNSIPQPTDAFPVSQPQLLNNFVQLNTQFGLEHQPLITGTGKHNYVTLKQGAGVAPTGTDTTLTQVLSPNNSQVPTFKTATTAYSIPYGIYVSDQSLIHGTHVNLYDMNLTGKFVSFVGTITIWTTADSNEISWCPFNYFFGLVHFPAGAPQLIGAGAEVTAFTSSGSIIQVNLSSNIHVSYAIYGMAL